MKHDLFVEYFFKTLSFPLFGHSFIVFSEIKLTHRLF